MRCSNLVSFFAALALRTSSLALPFVATTHQDKALATLVAFIKADIVVKFQANAYALIETDLEAVSKAVNDTKLGIVADGVIAVTAITDVAGYEEAVV
ncbi:hypothetical protein FRB97_002894 [Tulasnella sp. 331]|nr:hypothetical protein FRB97_002894 [Tulasnella sp. 331]KAG8868205.1 hypothetical protein FRB98_003740 [Tulasnella sp. 332]